MYKSPWVGGIREDKAIWLDSVGQWGIERRIPHTGNITCKEDQELNWNDIYKCKLAHPISTQIIIENLRKLSQFHVNIKDMATTASWRNRACLGIWITSLTENIPIVLLYLAFRKIVGLYRKPHLGWKSKKLWNLALGILGHIYHLVLSS